MLLIFTFFISFYSQATHCPINVHKNYPTETIKIRTEKMVADFVAPAGCDHTNKILIFFGGSEGGLHTNTANIFASKGFSTFTLGYFNVDGTSLPKQLVRLPMEYFVNAINEIKRLYPKARCCTLIGGSKGAEAILTLAAYSEMEIDGLVIISGSDRVFEGLGSNNRPSQSSSWTYKGKDLPYTPISNPSLWALFKMALSGFKEPPELKPIYVSSIQEPKNGNNGIIQVEKIKSNVLFLSGDDDNIWPASLMAENATRRMKQNGFKFKTENYSFQGVGHAVLGGEDALMNPKYQRILGGNHESTKAISPKVYEIIFNFIK